MTPTRYPKGLDVAASILAAGVLEKELPLRLDIDQVLRFGAVNAFSGNTDGPLFKDNNFYHYDSESGYRTYFPWDLDTGMKDIFDVMIGGGGGPSSAIFSAVLFPTWQERCESILRQLLAKRLSLSVIHGELDAIGSVAGSALASDPNLTGSPQDAVASLKTW